MALKKDIYRIVLLPLGAVVISSLVLLNGCGIESPETPRFVTTLNLPLKEEQYTGEDMARNLEAVEGNTEAPGPLTIRISESIDPIHLDDQISLGVATASYAAELEAISFDPPAIDDVTLTLGSLLPVPIVPGFSTAVESFLFTADPIDLGSFDDYASVRFAAGTIELSLTNNLPIPVGSAESGQQALEIRLMDHSTAPISTIALWQVDVELAPGDTYDGSVNLASQRVGNHLVLEVSGGSAGSDRELVELAESQSLDISLAFSSTSVSALTGKLPALTMETVASMSIDDDMTLERAIVESGQLTWQLQNDLPVTVHLRLATDQIQLGQSSLVREIDLPPQTPVDLTIDLAGAAVMPGETGQWAWSVAVSSDETDTFATVETGQSINIDLSEMELIFASVRGVLDQIEIDFAPVEADIQFPEGTEGVAFVAAEALLQITNRANITAVADLSLIGRNGDDEVSVDFSALIAAGSQSSPVVTEARLNESNSNIVDLLSLRPTTVWISGIVKVGDGETIGEVEAGDFIDGAFTLLAPLKLMLENASIDSEPFDVELDENVREEMMERLDEFTVHAEVENHFPTGVNVKLHFATSEGALFINDDLVMEAATILPAEFDPLTGRVTAPVTSLIEMTVARGDLDVFLLEQLFGAQEVTLVGDGENPVEIWSTDYVKVRGIASFQVEVK